MENLSTPCPVILSTLIKWLVSLTDFKFKHLLAQSASDLCLIFFFFIFPLISSLGLVP
jgi:hypothetical protein